ncbi:DDE-type integrase/transposase/recombinase [Litorimonas sp. WD9-15]|uniref:DDE-type integrase/transposase/recombinase n=1 Tax=Litorimonas sp. WD9-15 TaxID=3418716 RepID=UPI003D0664C9
MLLTDLVRTEQRSKTLGLKHLQDVGGRKNNRAECSHVPIRRRERKSQRFRSIRNAQRLLSAFSQIYNLFNFRRTKSQETLQENLELKLRMNEIS